MGGLVSSQKSNRRNVMTWEMAGNSNCEAEYELTVITVCYNAVGVIRRCISSVQPAYHIPGLRVEHLLIDGNSTDGTRELLQQELEAGRITRYISEPDSGLYDAMNKGIRNARGKVIVFINADDELCAEAARACCEPILNGAADYVMSSALVVNELKKKNHVRRPHESDFLLAAPCCHQAAFCSTESMRKLGGFNDKQYRLVADADLFSRLYCARARYSIVDAISTRYYSGGLSSSNQSEVELLNMVGCYGKELVIRCQMTPGLIKHVLKHIVRLWRRSYRGGSVTVLPESVEQTVCAIMSHMSASERQKIATKWRRKALINRIFGCFSGELSKKKISAHVYAHMASISSIKY